MRFTSMGLLVTVLLLLTTSVTLHAVKIYSINQLGITLNHNITWIKYVKRNTVIVPLYHVCYGDRIRVELSIDPLSNLGIKNTYLIMLNGSLVNVTYVNYSPKYVELNIPCSFIYGILIEMSSYESLPLMFRLVKGYTYSFTGLNKTKIKIPEVVIKDNIKYRYLFSIVEISAIDGDVTFNSPFSGLLNTTSYSSSIDGLYLIINKYRFITYSNNIEIKSSNRFHTVIESYYYNEDINDSRGILTIIQTSWFKVNEKDFHNTYTFLPKFSSKTIFINGTNDYNFSITNVTIYVNVRNCSNVKVELDNKQAIVDGRVVKINPLKRPITLKLYVNDYLTSVYVVNSVISKYIEVSAELITIKDITLRDFNNRDVRNVKVILYRGDEIHYLSGDECVVPGAYGVKIIANGEVIDLGVQSIHMNTVLKLPILSPCLNIHVLNSCPKLNLSLRISLNNLVKNVLIRDEYARICLSNVLMNSTLKVDLIGNDTILWSRRYVVNGEVIDIYIKPKIVKVLIVDMFDRPISPVTYIVSKLRYVNVEKLCIPENTDIIKVLHEGNVYYINASEDVVKLVIPRIDMYVIVFVLLIAICALILFIFMTLHKGDENGEKIIIIRSIYKLLTRLIYR